MQSDNKKKLKVGLALSGGGSRGFAHIGILKALNERGIFPDLISGVSAGAVVGAFYADGYNADDIYNIFHDKTLFRLMSLSVKKAGLLRMKGMVQMLTTYLRAHNLEDLKLPLYITATNFNTGKRHVFQEGNLIRTLRASSAIPILFQPVRIDNELFVDGGITSNLPVKPLEGNCDIIIGSNVNPLGQMDNFDNLLSIIDRAIHIGISTNVNENIRKCNLYIEPDELKQFPMMKFEDEYKKFQIGYEEAHRKLSELGI